MTREKPDQSRADQSGKEEQRKEPDKAPVRKDG